MITNHEMSINNLNILVTRTRTKPAKGHFAEVMCKVTQGQLAPFVIWPLKAKQCKVMQGAGNSINRLTQIATNSTL